MWRKSRKAGFSKANKNLLSLSIGAHQQQSSVLDMWPPSPSSLQASWGNRPSARTTTASVAGNTRDEHVAELVAQHEQIITTLSEKVVLLEDQLDRLQADIIPALKLVEALRQTSQQQQDPGQYPDGEAPNTELQQDAHTKDQAQVTAAVSISGKAQAQISSQAGQAAGSTEHAADTQKSAGWSQAVKDTQQTAADALHKALSGLLNDRDDCGSQRSFCTSISCGSTQVSGAAFMTDLRPAAKAPSRAVQQRSVQQQSHVQLSWDALGAGSVNNNNDASADPASWPLQLGMHEEASPEEIQRMIDIVTGQDVQASSDARNIDGAESSEAPELAQQQQQAISFLALHAEHDEEVREQLCTPRLLQCVTAMLQDTDLSSVQAAAHLVWYISRSHTLRQDLQEQKQLLPTLLSLLANEDAVSARAAAFTLNNLAHDTACRAAMVDAGAVAGLLDMLSGCDALGQEAAAAALMMLAREEASIRAHMVAMNSIPALVNVLRYGGPAAQEAAAAALENLSLDTECESALAADGAIEALLQVLRDGTTGTVTAAVGALRNLAVNEDLSEHLVSAGSVAAFVGLVGSADQDVGVRTAALEGLRNLAASSTHAGDAILQAGGVSVILDAARSLPAATARSAALGAILVLSCDEQHKSTVMAAGGAGVLVHAALSGSQTAKEYAARALVNISANEANRVELLREGAATVLAHLLKSQLASLYKAKEAQQGGSFEGGTCTDGSMGCCLAAARALQNMSKCWSGRKQLLESGCIPPLLAALSVPGVVTTAAASALCRLCTNKQSLQELIACDGCSKLLFVFNKPQHLTPRGYRHVLKLLRRLAKAARGCKGQIEQVLAATGAQVIAAS